MTFLSLSFFALVIGSLILYYLVPSRWRWVILLIGSGFFYYFAWEKGWYVILGTAAVAYVAGLLIKKTTHKKLITTIAILLVLTPWIFTKSMLINFINTPLLLIVPMGISFYTLGLISYLTDVSKEKIEPEKNPFKFLLFVTYFPQILQGPIPRYDKLAPQFCSPAPWEEKPFMEGALSIAWGFFLKLVIADKLVSVINPIFDEYPNYLGAWVLVGGLLYSIQLYTDFLACISISRGVSSLFGIRLDENFNQPYLATSVKDFWRRWHMSLSSWLKDYIYIPLGGNRKGSFRKTINIIITFVVSGIWHGVGIHYIIWGLMHAFYQIGEGVIYKKKPDSAFVKGIRRVITFILVMIAWIVFRSPGTRVASSLLKSVLTVHNWEIFTDGSLLNMGISGKNWIVLGIAVTVLIIAGIMKEKGIDIKTKILSMPLVLRWTFYLLTIFVIMTFGSYGVGFNAQSFIYGGF